jgi:hypothetical protein
MLELATAAGTDFKVLISPAHSHTVTVGKQDFIVFIEVPVPAPSTVPSPVPISIWSKDTKFDVPATFQPALIAAAAGSLCVEIEIESSAKANIVGLWLPSADR